MCSDGFRGVCPECGRVVTCRLDLTMMCLDCEHAVFGDDA